jgi:two-component system, NtrC family, response regulator AtoC
VEIGQPPQGLTDCLLALLPVSSSPVQVRVALAEDDVGLREVVAETLRDSGLEVVEAADGGSLLGIMRRGGVVVVVTDLMMPGLRGDDVLRLLRIGGDETPFVVITAASTPVVDAVLLSPHVTVLRKPFTVGALIEAVSRVVDERKAESTDSAKADVVTVAVAITDERGDDGAPPPG